MQGARRLPAGRTYISSAALDSTRRVPVNPLVGGGGFGVRAPGYCRAPARRRVAGRGLRKTDSGIGPTGREGSFGIAAITSPPPRIRLLLLYTYILSVCECVGCFCLARVCCLWPAAPVLVEVPACPGGATDVMIF